MAKHLTCKKDPKGKLLDALKVSAERGDFFGGMKNYKNMTVFDNKYANDGETGGEHPDWALFWIKRYSKANDKSKKKVYFEAYKKEHTAWMNRRVEILKKGHTPYMMTGVVSKGYPVQDPPKVYLYEGYEGLPSECRLWIFTP